MADPVLWVSGDRGLADSRPVVFRLARVHGGILGWDRYGEVGMSKLQIRNKRKGEAFVKRAAKNQKRKEVDVEIGEGAGQRLERLEARIEELESDIAMMKAQCGDVWAWWKRTQEGKE